jgi:hypothetical protein
MPNPLIHPVANAPRGCDPPQELPCPCHDEGVDPHAVLTERNRFFTGKYMTARDFRDEQSYFLSRHRLHQRALHGWGIVVGLDVCHHPDPECFKKGWLVVTPGIAVDSYGREIVLHESRPIKLDALFPHTVDCGCEKEHGRWREDLGVYWPNSPLVPGEGSSPEFLLGIRYGEVCVEPVPVLYDDTHCGERTAPNRIREQPCFRYREHEPGDGCWDGEPLPSPCDPPPTPDPCRCLDRATDFTLPESPCGDPAFVPLGLFKFRRREDGTVVLEKEAYSGRRYLHGPLHPHTLTHICALNWKHGEKTAVHDLLTHYEEGRARDEGAGHADAYQHHDDRSHKYLRLTITFDDCLCSDLPLVEECEGVGFYRRFFRVRYDSHTGELLPLSEHGLIHLSRCRRKLHYDIPYRCLAPARRGLQDPIIHITLNCDFLPDRKGRAVDGNHLRGSLKHTGRKTGDGIEGGTFESWFKLDW